jgi:hypothetical protein
MPTRVRSDQLQIPSKFSAYRAAAANSGNGAFADVAFDTELFDTGSNFNTSNGIFTAPVAGFYQFDAQVEFQGSTTVLIVALQKNSDTELRGSRNTTAGGAAFSGSAHQFLQLAASDTVKVRAFASTTTAIQVGQQNTYFSGFLVSAT